MKKKHTFCCTVAVLALVANSCENGRSGIQGDAVTDRAHDSASDTFLPGYASTNGHQASAATSYELIYSTYLGGSAFDRTAGDQFTDAQGNLYLVGNTESPDFPVTAGSFDFTHNGGSDGFVAKFNASGLLLWATYLGGPHRDELYGVEVDSSGFVYVAGAFSNGAPTTAGTVQPAFAGGDGLTSGGVDWDGYIAKFTPDGSDVAWATYLGHPASNDAIRSMSLDPYDNIVVSTGAKAGNSWPSDWFSKSFQSTPQGGDDALIIKVKSDGSSVLWATHLGGSGDEARGTAVKVDAQGYIYVLTNTRSSDMPTTSGAYDRTHNGGIDAYFARISPDGKSLVSGTYLGTAENDGSGEKSPIAIDSQGNAVFMVWTFAADFPTTPSAVYPAPVEAASWGAMSAILKVSPSATLLASSYAGHLASAESVGVDGNDNVYTVGSTSMSSKPVTPDAFQRTNAGGSDAYIEVLTSDLSAVTYSTYYGGTGRDYARMCWLDKINGAFYVFGNTDGFGFPLLKASQPSLGGGEDVFIAKFARVSTP
jgi:hypothetical protein